MSDVSFPSQNFQAVSGSSSSFSIDKLSGIMVSAIAEADQKVRDLLQSLDDSNVKISDGTSLLSTDDGSTVSINKIVKFYNDNIADQNNLDASNTDVSDRISKGETVSGSSSLSTSNIQAIKNKIQTYVDSLSAKSQQFYLDVQQAMNQYTLQIQAWTQILQVFGKALDDPLQRI